MEKQSRRTWTIVIVVAVLAALCCCLAATAAVALSWLLGFPSDVAWGPGVEGDAIKRTYDVGRSPELSIDSFAGEIVVRAGEGDEIRVMATQHARRRSDLDRVGVDIQPRAGRLEIVTSNPDRLNGAWVRLEVVAPVGTSYDLRTSAGSLEIIGLNGGGKAESSAGDVSARDLRGVVALHTSAGVITVRNFEGSLKLHSSAGGIEVEEIAGNLDVHTSAGRIDVRGAQGPIHLDASTGSIDYQGSPAGDCSFETGTGSISLRLPSDPDVRVDLETGSGSITVDFPLEGDQSRQTVRGVIGDGSDASISAQTGTGSISLGQY